MNENEVKAVIRLFSLKLSIFRGTPSIHDVSGADYSPLLVVCYTINPLNAELNPICHLLALLGAHHILHVSRIRVKKVTNFKKFKFGNRLVTKWVVQHRT